MESGDLGVHLGEGKQLGRGVGIRSTLSEGIEDGLDQASSVIERPRRAGGLGRRTGVDGGQGALKGMPRGTCDSEGWRRPSGGLESGKGARAEILRTMIY